MKRPLSKIPKIGFHDQLPLNAGQKYCRILQGEHSAIPLTFIKLPFVIKIFVLSIFEWPFYTYFTVLVESVNTVAEHDQLCNSTMIECKQYACSHIIVVTATTGRLATHSMVTRTRIKQYKKQIKETLSLVNAIVRYHSLYIWASSRENLIFLHTKNKIEDHPALPRSLTNAHVIGSLETIIANF